jgi:hypothetical protein
VKFEEIGRKEVPEGMRARQEHVAIYKAAQRLLAIGPDRAIKLRVEAGVDVDLIRRKAHVFYRNTAYKMRTHLEAGYLYLWIENRTPAPFTIAAVPRRA